ncbi:ABC transporter permease [Capnocytophaga canis]|uniref:ABC transporter permease n=1 Tax=Capnocytophaga canis TaxID=1848903 RepID=UPI0037CDF799
MLRLLQIELIKIWNSKSSRILIIAYFGSLAFLALFATVKIDFGAFVFHLAKQGIFDFPFVWHFNTYMAAFFKLFFAIVVVSMVANEYSNKTLKQNLIDGLSKKEFVYSKFLTIVLFSAISTLVVSLVSLVLGLIYSKYDEILIIFSQLEYLLAYFVKLVGFFTMCLFFSVLTRKSAFSLGFLALWYVIEQFLAIFSQRYESLGIIKRILPLEAMSNLIKQPFTRMNGIKEFANETGINIPYDFSVQISDILIVCCWTILFVLMSYKIIKNRDL